MTSTETTQKRPASIATDLALIATFAAFIVALASLGKFEVSGIPLTFQTLGVMLAGAILGAKRGALAVLLYIALGLAGLPVFSGGTSGFGVLTGQTGGYLIGFVPAAALCGFLVERFIKERAASNVLLVFLAGLVSSIIFVHPFGIAGWMIVNDVSFSAALAVDMVTWPGDAIKNLVMAFIATSVHRGFPDVLIERTK